MSAQCTSVGPSSRPYICDPDVFKAQGLLNMKSNQKESMSA